MLTSWHVNAFSIDAHCAVNLTVTKGFPSHWTNNIFFVLNLNKLLNNIYIYIYYIRLIRLLGVKQLYNLCKEDIRSWFIVDYWRHETSGHLIVPIYTWINVNFTWTNAVKSTSWNNIRWNLKQNTIFTLKKCISRLCLRNGGFFLQDLSAFGPGNSHYGRSFKML